MHAAFRKADVSRLQTSRRPPAVRCLVREPLHICHPRWSLIGVLTVGSLTETVQGRWNVRSIADLDCKTVYFFLKSVKRSLRVSLSPNLSVFSLDPDILTSRAYLNTQKLGLFCSPLIADLVYWGSWRKGVVFSLFFLFGGQCFWLTVIF